jgi:release factor glutamine methyltransferase
VVGHWEFFGLDFDLAPAVLIPRPETEMLVEKAIAWIKASPERRLLVDVGTGSGAIGISIAKNVPGAGVMATDISLAALEVANQNARKHQIADRIEFIHCDLLPTSSHSRFDLICANLPYIPTDKLHGLPVHGREPDLALDGGADGLDLIRGLLNLSIESLNSRGLLLLEIEATQGPKAISLARKAYPGALIHVHRDLAGHDRLLEIAP